jgi:hypothetical protein
MARVLSERTLKMYAQLLAKLTNPKELNLDPKTPDITIPKVMSLPKSTSTLRGYLSALHHSVKGNPNLMKPYSDKIKELGNIDKVKDKKQELSETEVLKYMKWPEILEAVKRIKTYKIVSDSDKLLLDFYTMMPPKRADYSGLKVYNTPPTVDTGNYIVIQPKKESYVKINNHKTEKTYGPIHTVLPAPLKKSVTAYLKKYPDTKTLWPGMSDAQFSNHIASIFVPFTGKRIGINILRHAYISNFLEAAPPLLEKEAVAKHMGHSVAEQELYRRLDIKTQTV